MLKGWQPRPAPQYSRLRRTRCSAIPTGSTSSAKEDQEPPFTELKKPPCLLGAWGTPGPWQGSLNPPPVWTGLDRSGPCFFPSSLPNPGFVTPPGTQGSVLPSPLPGPGETTQIQAPSEPTGRFPSTSCHPATSTPHIHAMLTSGTPVGLESNWAPD